jgi:hypothetical protein
MFFLKNFGRSIHYFFTALILWSQLAGVVLPVPNNKSYPRIVAANLVMKINRGEPTKSKEVIIKDISGKPAYRLAVYCLSLDKQTTNSIRVELNGIGSISTQSDTQYEADLLNPDRWGHGAGQRVFVPEELCLLNRNDPMWGARRVFTLRRMRIEVVISDIELNQSFNGITRAHLAVHISPSISVRSRPADVPYNEPKACK